MNWNSRDRIVLGNSIAMDKDVLMLRLLDNMDEQLGAGFFLFLHPRLRRPLDQVFLLFKSSDAWKLLLDKEEI